MDSQRIRPVFIRTRQPLLITLTSWFKPATANSEFVGLSLFKPLRGRLQFIVIPSASICSLHSILCFLRALGLPCYCVRSPALKQGCCWVFCATESHAMLRLELLYDLRLCFSHST